MSITCTCDAYAVAEDCPVHGSGGIRSLIESHPGCSCLGHTFPGVHHVVACCDRPHVDQQPFPVTRAVMGFIEQAQYGVWRQAKMDEIERARIKEEGLAKISRMLTAQERERVDLFQREYMKAPPPEVREGFLERLGRMNRSVDRDGVHHPTDEEFRREYFMLPPPEDPQEQMLREGREADEARRVERAAWRSVLDTFMPHQQPETD